MPTKILLEDYVPYDKSIQWQLHDAYFARRGIAAWTAGDVPYFSTNNYAIARQHALFLIALVRDLDRRGRLSPGEPVYALEIGSGLGQFVVNLFLALDEGTGRAGKELGKRLRYIFSDYSETSVREAIRSEGMRALEQSGRLTPALFDVRRPQAITGLDGRPFQAQITALYSNYVCCVTHMKHLRKTVGGFLEKHVRIHAEVPDPAPGTESPTAAHVLAGLFEKPTQPDLQKELQVDNEWRPCDLDRVFSDPVHAATVRETLAPLAEATLGYPYAFLDMLRGLRSAMRPDGVYLVNDYGTSEHWEIRGLVERRPQHYGNTMNQGVDYPVFDAFAKTVGLGIMRTKNPLRSVHVAAIRPAAGMPAPVARAFKAAFIDREDGEDMLDFGAAARQWMKAEEPSRAARLLQRCLRLDPLSAEAHYRFGDACLDAGHNEPALRTLERGRALPGSRGFDFDFAIGRACYRLKHWKKAEQAYRASIEREDDAVTRANLGVIYEEKGDYKRAYACYKRSSEMKPDYERAKTLLRSLEALWAEKTLGTKLEGKADPGDDKKPVTTRAVKDGIIEETISFGTPPDEPTSAKALAKLRGEVLLAAEKGRRGGGPSTKAPRKAEGAGARGKAGAPATEGAGARKAAAGSKGKGKRDR